MTALPAFRRVSTVPYFISSRFFLQCSFFFFFFFVGVFLLPHTRWGHPRGKHGGQHGGRATAAGRIATGERLGGGPLARVDSSHAQEPQAVSFPVNSAEEKN